MIAYRGWMIIARQAMPFRHRVGWRKLDLHARAAAPFDVSLALVF
jgi:hypothetical protein